MEDKQILEAIKLEEERQKNHIELIASENYVSKDVLTATGSVLTNKYAEGYPGKRYYNGTKYVDIVENLARERLKKLFNVKYVNVQPHSGSQANAAAFAALIKPGEKIMGLSLKSGGHLSHGYKISFSGTFYKSVNYDVDKDGFLNYKQILNLAKKEKPNLIIAGYSAYSRLIDFKKFKKIAKAVNAYLLVDMAHIAGLIAGKAIPSPVKYADVITSTTQKTLRGARGGIIMTNNKDLAKKIDMSVFPGQQGGPLMHSIAGKAVTFFEALKPSFKQYARQIIKNAKAFSNAFKKLGCKIVAGGTDTHLFTIDVKSSYKITGLEASTYLQKNNITVNKNTIPFDSESPFVTSGIRLGTAAMTSRGFKEKEFIELAKIIDEILKNPDVLVKDKVNKLIKNFPIKDKY